MDSLSENNNCRPSTGTPFTYWACEYLSMKRALVRLGREHENSQRCYPNLFHIWDYFSENFKYLTLVSFDLHVCLRNIISGNEFPTHGYYQIDWCDSVIIVMLMWNRDFVSWQWQWNDNENMFITIDLHVYKIQDARYKYTENKHQTLFFLW